MALSVLPTVPCACIDGIPGRVVEGGVWRPVHMLPGVQHQAPVAMSHFDDRRLRFTGTRIELPSRREGVA